MTVSLWAAMAVGCAGVIAGLVAVARGACPPVGRSWRPRSWPWRRNRAPAAGSTDSISYAASGGTAVIGDSPYVTTLLQLQRGGDPVGLEIPSREIRPAG